MNTHQKFIYWLDEVDKNSTLEVGGKNANLGEMYQHLTNKPQPILVPYGFAISTSAFNYFLKQNNLLLSIAEQLQGIEKKDIKDLDLVSANIQKLIIDAEFPSDLKIQIEEAVTKLAEKLKLNLATLDVAVRSSGILEDTTTLSFAGQAQSYLNCVGVNNILESVKKTFASLYTSAAISYRKDVGLSQQDVQTAVCVQKMVRSDLGLSGVIFSLDTENGFSDLVLINASYGLGEVVTKGEVTPDEYKVLKSMINKGPSAIIEKYLGSKEKKAVYSDKTGGETTQVAVDYGARHKFALNDEQILELARQAMLIEAHFKQPMDIEWAYDGKSGQLFIVQARPQTAETKRKNLVAEEMVLIETGNVITQGLAVGKKVGVGKARYLKDFSDMHKFKAGEILVTQFADAQWEPVIKIASGIVTDLGGRASHAAIIARELGVPAVVGTSDATILIKDGQEITISCAEGEVGKVYEGQLKFKIKGIE